jgi:SPP1 gp7 family putative phage head morphogenesis protein
MSEKKEDNNITEEEAEKQAEKIASNFYDFDKDVTVILSILIPIYLQAGELGNVQFNTIQFGIQATADKGVLFAIIRDDYLTWLQEYGGNKIVQINETTKEITKRIIKEGLLNGDGVEAIAKNLSDKIEEYSLFRARRIALTEMHNSYMRGNFISAEASGFKYKKWISSKDSHVRSSHQQLNGKIVKINEDFKPNLGYPGDSRGIAKEVINCRCILTYTDKK